jgi:hypothetical protein
MKNVKKSAKSEILFDQIISKISEKETLNPEAMNCVRGGSTDGEGGSGTPVIIVPK